MVDTQYEYQLDILKLQDYTVQVIIQYVFMIYYHINYL
jgi:hypothetical protein